MKLSIDNKRLTVTDNPELALTPGQKQLFSHWEQGFKAQAEGTPYEDCPHIQRGRHKVRNVWRQGWLAGAAVDNIMAAWLPPKHNPNHKNSCHTVAKP